MAVDYRNYPPATGNMIVGSVVSFCGMLIMLISYASPYWLESYPETYSNFVNLGLWEVCFHEFRYPRYQFDKKFNGCHYIYSQEYLILREWLLPGWYLFVQGAMSVALLLALGALACISIVLMRFFLKYEWIVLGFTWILQLLAAGFIFLSVAVFGGKCWDRSWLLYPNFNHLSWSYGLSVIAMFIFGFSAILMLLVSTFVIVVNKDIQPFSCILGNVPS
ncbi:hypothetical protein CHUAL_002918 [Chamberlinius hualienensis]